MDFVAACLEEIALEGLDGITLDALWLRLESKKPKFPLPIDEYSKKFMWQNVIVRNEELEFYELPEERKPLVLFNRFEYTDVGTGIVLEQKELHDIYPICIVEDQKKNIRGSCSTYYSRACISKLIRDKEYMAKLSLIEATESWGSKLVIVASQDLRCKTLIGEEKTDVGMEMAVRSYVFLERVGRARWHGEITHGYNSMKCLDDSPKTLFYIRKKLRNLGLVSSQIFNSRLLSGQNVGGTLIHLKRYYVEHQPIYVKILQQMCLALNETPLKCEQHSVLRERLNIKPGQLKRALAYATASKLVEGVLMKYSDFCPGATQKECINSNGTEKLVKVVKLLKMYQSGDCIEECMDSDEEEAIEGLGNVKVVYEKSLIDQAYEYCCKQGKRGVTQPEIAAMFNLSKLEARMVARYFEREGLTQKVLLDQGRQRVQRYVAKEFVKSRVTSLEKEMQRILAPNPQSVGDASMLDDTTQTNDSMMSQDLNLSCIELEHQHQKKGDAHITFRWLRRAEVIMEHIRDVRILDNTHTVKKKIVEMEEKEGLKTIIDKKSVMRIVNRLQQSGKLCVYKKTISINDTESKPVVLICDKDVAEDDPVIKTYLESEEQKIRALNRMHQEEMKRKHNAKVKSEQNEEECFDSVPRDPAFLNYALLTSKMMVKDMTYDSAAGRRYGYRPKFRRAELLHKYLWYLLYGYNLDDNSDLAHMELTLQQNLDDMAISVDDPIPDSVLSTYKVYCNDYTWKRFVPPLPEHKGYPAGWFLTGDILLIMPVSIFMSLIRINYRIPGLMKILQDPIRRHVTVSQLPSAIRQAIMVGRKYLLNLSYILVQLCQLGLLSFAGRELREKHQVYGYLHQTGSYIDTTVESVDDRVTHLCNFNSYDAVSKFWFTVQYTAINTAISSVTEPKSRSGNTEMNEKFKDALSAKSPETIADVGIMPGDGKGACGFDSITFMHLKRNWYWHYDNDIKVNAMLDTDNRTSEEGSRGARGPKLRRVGKIPYITTKKPLTPKSINLPTSENAERGLIWDSSTRPSTAGETSNTSPLGMKNRASKSPKTKPKFEKVIVTGEAAIPKKGGKGIKRKKTNENTEEKAPPVKKHKPYAIFQAKRYITDERGRKVSLKGYDTLDQEILLKRDRERVDWTDEEDSLILMIEVTQRFLSYPICRRDILVSYYCIRDLLHENSPKFVNKTSKAVQRRLHYILKNKQTEINIDVFVGEALQDPVLHEKYKRTVYSKALAVEKLEQIYKEAYFDLKNKFSTQQLTPTVQLPDTIEAVKSNYSVESTLPQRLSRFTEVTNNSDICFWVLHNVIHCSMLLHDKSGRAHELFQLFNQYPEELLLGVFNCMKNDGLITKLKDKNSKAGKTMPWNKISIGNPGLGGYQVSQRYMYHWFAKQYPKQVFENANCNLEKFTETPGHCLEMEENGGFVAVTVALMANRKIKFDTVIPEHIITVQSQTGKSDVKKQKGGLPAAIDSDEEEDDALLAEAERNRKDKQGQHNLDKDGKAVMVTETDSHIEFQPENYKSTSRAMLNLMHTTYYGYCNIRGYNPDSNLVVNGCNVKVHLKAEKENNGGQDITQDLSMKVKNKLHDYNSDNIFIHQHSGREILKNIRMTYPSEVDMDQVIEICKETYFYTTEDINEMLVLCDYIREPGSLGIIQSHLKNMDFILLQDFIGLNLHYKLFQSKTIIGIREKVNFITKEDVMSYWSKLRFMLDDSEEPPLFIL